MRFTVLSHAGLAVEHDGKCLVIDPWVMGSCYWRSWWNFPEPPAELIANLKPDFIYLTHLHWDHFHGVSLRHFDPGTPVLVPRTCTRRMVEDLAYLGFKNAREVPHSASVVLGNDFRLHSFQFGIGVDSAVVIEAGDKTLFNVNDCKYFGEPLRNLLSHFGPIDFVLRSHSSARAIPYCIEGYEERFPNIRTRDDYIEEFSRFAIYIGARYAIPFASNHCYLHPETERYNSIAVNPASVAERCNALAREVGVRTQCVVMPAGSSWSSATGFCVREFDYSERAEYIRELKRRHEATIARAIAEEAKEAGDLTAFRSYFEGFLAAVPQPMRRWILEPFGFRVRDCEGDRTWVVDVASGKVSVHAVPPPEHIVFETAAKILNDCTRNRMFSVWTASKRLRIHIPRDKQLRAVGALFSLLDAYELELLPLKRNLGMRSLAVHLSRWREGAEAARLLLRHGVLRRPFVPRDLYPLPAAIAAVERGREDRRQDSQGRDDVAAARPGELRATPAGARVSSHR